MSAEIKPDDFSAEHTIHLTEAQTNDLLKTADMYGLPSDGLAQFALVVGLATLQRLWERAPDSRKDGGNAGA